MATDSIAYKDLRGYLDAADKLGELRIVDGADWDLEIGAITEVAARAAQAKGRALRQHQRLSKRISRRDQSCLFAGDDGVGFWLGPQADRVGYHSRVERKTRQPEADQAHGSVERADNRERRQRRQSRFAQISHAALARG